MDENQCASCRQTNLQPICSDHRERSAACTPSGARVGSDSNCSDIAIPKDGPGRPFFIPVHPRSPFQSPSIRPILPRKGRFCPIRRQTWNFSRFCPPKTPIHGTFCARIKGLFHSFPKRFLHNLLKSLWTSAPKSGKNHVKKGKFGILTE